MLRKVFLFLMLLSVSVGFLVADDLALTFQPTVAESLYKEPIADPYSYNTNIHVTIVPKAEDNEFRFKSLVHDKTDDTYFYDDFAYQNPRKKGDNLFINMKVSGVASLFRTRLDAVKYVPAVDLELNVAGYINTFFDLTGGADTLDFDGSYFFAGSARIADCLTVRAGLHHFSGHYGDETLGDMYEYNQIDFGSNGLIKNYTGLKKTEGHEYEMLPLVEYVRDNSWLIGASADLPRGFRIYGECEIPQRTAWIRPFIHVPADYDSPVGNANETNVQRSSNREGVPDDVVDAVEAQKRGSSYKALRIHGGVEYTYPLSWGNIRLSADLQAHQDGQNKNHEILSYDAKNPWELEFTVGAALELKDVGGGRLVRLQAFYHDGRLPGTQWFYKRGSFIYVGLGLN